MATKQATQAPAGPRGKRTSPTEGQSKAGPEAATKPVVKAARRSAKSAAAKPKVGKVGTSAHPGNGEQAGAAKKKKVDKREKVIRDSFTMPKHDFEKIAELKALCLKHGVVVKKSELLRAGLVALATLPEKKLLAVVASVEPVKTGRPASH